MYGHGSIWINVFSARCEQWRIFSKPNRFSSPQQVGTIHAEVEAYTLNEAVSKADLIAKVKITSKIKEINEPSEKTLYQAEVVEDFLNKTDLKEINVMQAGNSQWKFNNNKLFKSGDSYILYLKKAIGEAYENFNTYWILGEETGIYQDLGSGKLMKWAYPETFLSDIEDKARTNELLISEGEVQVLDEAKFIEKINDIKNVGLVTDLTEVEQSVKQEDQ
ncbi:hypothetical protein [Paenibacillus montanisoli]|uniref:Uncharacterized protein n=1 Tax=Paenibacillus montanisoli TaxID=2081970 RepID=A0A328U7G5_9BACL|nr:hypothetical protein [Paenibacillus montanisoli]RAP78499.1 hypothetical protein DL346_08790 [Paenibacillus montanisoli]